MPISVGDRLPEAEFLTLGAGGRPEAVALADRLKGRRIALFGLPGAYTGTCTTAHLPSFVRSMDRLREKGVDEVICVSVNDPFVMGAWGEATGAAAAGITMLGDASGEFTRAIGMEFTAPPAGLYGRSKRYTMLVDDLEVRVLNVEDSPGVCNISAGETLVEQL